MFYCDHNATSPLRPICREAVMRALAIGGNPASVHGAGRAARAIVEEARARVAELAAAKADQVIFTSGATEANALALWGAAEGAMAGDTPITRLLVSATAHSSLLMPARQIAARTPAMQLQILPVTPDGVLDIAALRALLGKDGGRALVAVMAANNETGVVQPLAEISRLAREAGALLLVDAVAAAGKLTLDAALCDYLTLSAHKLGGPQGSGALIVAENAPLAPQLTGGGQQKGLRAGTENLSGIAGFGAAAQAVLQGHAERDHMKALRDRFETALRAALPDAVIFGSDATRLCGTSNVALPGLSGENIVIALDLDGIAVSSGSACSSGKVAPSHVLSAMGVDDALAASALRVSFGWNSTLADGDAVVAALLRLSARVQSRSSERAA